MTHDRVDDLLALIVFSIIAIYMVSPMGWATAVALIAVTYLTSAVYYFKFDDRDDHGSK